MIHFNDIDLSIIGNDDRLKDNRILKEQIKDLQKKVQPIDDLLIRLNKLEKQVETLSSSSSSSKGKKKITITFDNKDSNKMNVIDSRSPKFIYCYQISDFHKVKKNDSFF